MYIYYGQLWEILVPTIRRIGGKPYRTKFHKVWDSKVRDISGGLTIMPVAKGQWIHGGEKEGLFCERMIPVRIYATRDQMEKIVDMSSKYYDQIAICWYLVSSDFNISYNKELTSL